MLIEDYVVYPCLLLGLSRRGQVRGICPLARAVHCFCLGQEKRDRVVLLTELGSAASRIKMSSSKRRGSILLYLVPIDIIIHRHFELLQHYLIIIQMKSHVRARTVCHTVRCQRIQYNSAMHNSRARRRTTVGRTQYQDVRDVTSLLIFG